MANITDYVNIKRLEKQVAICLFILKIFQFINVISFGLVDCLNVKFKFLEAITIKIIGRKIIK